MACFCVYILSKSYKKHKYIYFFLHLPWLPDKKNKLLQNEPVKKDDKFKK